jgi:hypothetical protein
MEPQGFYGLAGRWARHCPDPELALLSVAAFAGSYLGRRISAYVNEGRCFPNLIVLAVGRRPPVINPIAEFFSACVSSPGPRIIQTGVQHREALLSMMHDEFRRPEKVCKEPEDDPEYRMTTIEGGEPEKRSLIIQRTLIRGLRGKTKSAVSLREVFVEAFYGLPLKTYMNYTAGGFLECKEPHVSVLTSGTWDECHSLPVEIFDVALLVVSSETATPSSGLADIPNAVLGAVVAAFERMLARRAAILPVDSRAEAIIGGDLRAAKLALVFASLDGADRITVAHAAAAAAVVQYSNLVRALIDMDKSARESAVLKDQVLRAIRERPGITRTGLLNWFHRNTLASGINIALFQLEREGKVRHLCIPSGEHGGRPAEGWYAAELQ